MQRHLIGRNTACENVWHGVSGLSVYLTIAFWRIGDMHRDTVLSCTLGTVQGLISFLDPPLRGFDWHIAGLGVTG